MFVLGLMHSVDVSAVAIDIAGNVCSEMSGKLSSYQCSMHFDGVIILFTFYGLLFPFSVFF